MLILAEFKGCVTWFMCFLDLLLLRYNYAKFPHCWICDTDFSYGELLAPPPPPPIGEQIRKGPSWIGLISCPQLQLKNYSMIVFKLFMQICKRYLLRGLHLPEKGTIIHEAFWWNSFTWLTRLHKAYHFSG